MMLAEPLVGEALPPKCDPCDEIGNRVSHVISPVATGVKTRLSALA